MILALGIIIALIGLLVFVYGLMAKSEEKRRPYILGGLLVGAVGAITLIASCVISIPPGHIGVATFFGKVVDQPYEAGIHLTNPLYDWEEFDCRQKSITMSQVPIPSMDQLVTTFDVSCQYRIIKSMAPDILQETGNPKDLMEVHMLPKFRSLLREQGKSVKTAESFFREEIQQKMQANLLTSIKEYVAPKGLDVEAVLIRNIQLPNTIQQGVESKKKREQEAEREKAELRRFETEQQKKVKTAQADKDAAMLSAEKQKILADAKAYEIQKVNDAIANNPAYIQLEALKALGTITKDPATKVYFLNGDSPKPLPLMHLGEGNRLNKERK